MLILNPIIYTGRFQNCTAVSSIFRNYFFSPCLTVNPGAGPQSVAAVKPTENGDIKLLGRKFDFQT